MLYSSVSWHQCGTPLRDLVFEGEKKWELTIILLVLPLKKLQSKPRIMDLCSFSFYKANSKVIFLWCFDAKFIMVSIPFLHNMALKSTWVNNVVKCWDTTAIKYNRNGFFRRFKLFQFLHGVVMCMNKSISFYISVGFMAGYWEKVE